LGAHCEEKGDSKVKLQEYRTYLREQGIPEGAVEQQMILVGDFVEFLLQLGFNKTATAGKAEVEEFARKLIAEGRNTLGNFSLLRDYALWLGCRSLYVALIEVMDCHNALAVLADEIGRKHSLDTRMRIFREALPPLGADERERGDYTQKVMERMAHQLTPQEAGDAWFQVQHGIPAETWRRSDAEEKEKFRKCGDIDTYLDLKRQERDVLLTRLRDENKLWYTVVITDEVLEFVRSDPEMEVGRREGNKIYISKIPYNAVRYLHETDVKKKRYYACHCPLLREAILKDQPVSPVACHCSLGHASHYVAGLGQELRGEVLESAIKGDSRCRFVFYIPDEDGLYV
jgi:hypothetical protein